MTYGILIQDRDELVYVFKRYTHIYTFEIKKRLNVPQCFSMMVVQVGKDLLLVQETQEMWVRSWDGKIPRRRKQQPTPGIVPGKFPGQRSLTGCSPQGRKRAGHDRAPEHARRQRGHSRVTGCRRVATRPYGGISDLCRVCESLRI